VFPEVFVLGALHGGCEHELHVFVCHGVRLLRIDISLSSWTQFSSFVAGLMISPIVFFQPLVLPAGWNWILRF
jgi:hypothetical protein